MTRRAPGPWVRISTSIGDHPKLDAVGPLGLAAHVEAITYSARQATDGRFPVRRVHAWLAGFDVEQMTREMVDTGLWHESGHDCASCEQPPAGSLQVHDFLDWQESAEHREAVRAKRSEAGRRSGERRFEQSVEQSVQQKQKENEKENAGTARAPADEMQQVARQLADKLGSEDVDACADVVEQLRQRQRGNGSLRSYVDGCWRHDADDLSNKLQAVQAARQQRDTERELQAQLDTDPEPDAVGDPDEHLAWRKRRAALRKQLSQGG